MTWLDKFETENGFGDDKYIKLGGEQDVTISMTVEPVRRQVVGTDGKERLYWDLETVDKKVLSCTNYLFGTIRKELDQLKGKELSTVTLRIKKVLGDKVSWIVVLKNYD